MNILYCSLEPHNPIDKLEIERLSQTAKVTVLTTHPEYRELTNDEAIFFRIHKIGRMVTQTWLNFATLICKIPNSQLAKRFPERNVYQKSKLIEWIANFSWNLRKYDRVNQILPRYSVLIYMFPWDFFLKSKKVNQLKCDAIVYNSLHIVSGDFIPIIKKMSKRGVVAVANIRSWDNPYYIQFDTEAHLYLTWSPFMADTIIKAQEIPKDSLLYISWGPNLIRNFFYHCMTNKVKLSPSINDQAITIGYAGAFGEITLAQAEYRLICELSQKIEASGIRATILYRPYPTISAEQLKTSKSKNKVFIYEIDSEVTDRYGNSREIIRYGTPLERRKFLDSCSLFLSLGTTFTLEALVYGINVLHFYLPPGDRMSQDENTVFTRVEITCDHFFDYFGEVMTTLYSTNDLIGELRSWSSRSPTDPTNNEVLNRVGLPYLDSNIAL